MIYTDPVLDIHSARLYQLNEQGKGPFLRQTKHFEETSELAEAVVAGDNEEIIREGIDGLLMLLSIAADYTTIEEFSRVMPIVVNGGFFEHLKMTEGLEPPLRNITRAFRTLQYIGTLQHITSAVQRFEGVASSQYKDSVGRETIFDAIATSVDHLMDVLTMCETGLDDGAIQQVYNEKMDKWEKVSK